LDVPRVTQVSFDLEIWWASKVKLPNVVSEEVNLEFLDEK
jgi:hypothetical protein